MPMSDQTDNNTVPNNTVPNNTVPNNTVPNNVSTDGSRSNASADKNADNNRIFWASRRGMLELDLVLMPYAKGVYPSLSSADQQDFQLLLDSEDTDLFAWFLQKSVPEDAVLAAVVAKVLDFARTRPL